MVGSRWFSIALALLVVVGVGGWVSPFVLAPDAGGDEFTRERVFVRADGRITEAALYVPSGERPRPGIVFGAGSGSEPAMYAGYGETLARQGFVVLIPGPTYELEDGSPVPWMIVRDDTVLWKRATENYLNWMAYLEAHPRVDDERIVVGGHSGGANGAYRAAYERDDVRGLVAIAGRFPPERPDPLQTNVLLATGSDDSLVPPSTLVEISEPLTGTKLEPGDRTGSFEDGTAAGVFVADGATHLSESSDPSLVAATAEWSLLSVGETPPDQYETTGRPIRTALQQFAFGLVGVLAATALVAREGVPSLDSDYRSSLPPTVAVVGFVAVVGTTLSESVYHLWPAPSQFVKYVLFAGILAVVGGVLLRGSERIPRLETRYGAVLFDVAFVAVSMAVFVLVSTRFVTFQLVTTVVLSGAFLLLLLPVVVLLSLLERDAAPRWVFSSLAVLWLYPAVVPPYL
ncbi:dienelactone hydrolase family protein [Haloferax sp. YSMS24]|uniref:dienelactone hydrolase family protein n=1 Tax=Haloferax sp. YSMS24 TaxID=3388425 RepID=UPI00398C9B66